MAHLKGSALYEPGNPIQWNLFDQRIKETSMGEKEGQTMGRLGLADFLQNLSGQLRRGTLEMHGRHWTIPEDLDVEIHFKEKKGHLVAKLTWSWSTLGDYDSVSQVEVNRWQDSMKAVKKQMGAAFKELQRVATQGGFPDERILGNFVEVSQSFAAMAEPDWQAAMQEYMDHLANLQHAVASRQQEVMLHELRDLQACMGSCHREFKSRPAGEK
jgi:XXXCH domain-containing protein